MQSTGLDQVIKPGTIVERVYFVVPDTIGLSWGDEHETMVGALAESLVKAAERATLNPAAPTKITVDCRWTVRLPDGRGTNDFVAQRSTFVDAFDAHVRLQQIKRYQSSAAA